MSKQKQTKKDQGILDKIINKIGNIPIGGCTYDDTNTAGNVAFGIVTIILGIGAIIRILQDASIL